MFNFLLATASITMPVGAQPPAPEAKSAAGSLIPNVSLSWSGYFEALGILFLILAALWALLWFLKKRGGGIFAAPAPLMRLESRLALGPKKWLYVVRYMDRRLMLGVCDKSITLLADDPTPPEVLAEERSRSGSLFGRKDKAGSRQQESSAGTGQPPGAGDFAKFLKGEQQQ
jgi:flagellar biosynthetic protein FliO